MPDERNRPQENSDVYQDAERRLCPCSLKADGPCEHGEYDVHPIRSRDAKSYVSPVDEWESERQHEHETICERFRYAGVHPDGGSRLCECGLKYDEHRPAAQAAERQDACVCKSIFGGPWKGAGTKVIDPECPVCGYAESMHVPPGGPACPLTTGRARGEGAYVDR